MTGSAMSHGGFVARVPSQVTKVDPNADVREHGGQHDFAFCQRHYNRSRQPPVVTVWPPQLTLQTRPL